MDRRNFIFVESDTIQFLINNVLHGEHSESMSKTLLILLGVVLVSGAIVMGSNVSNIVASIHQGASVQQSSLTNSAQTQMYHDNSPDNSTYDNTPDHGDNHHGDDSNYTNSTQDNSPDHNTNSTQDNSPDHNTNSTQDNSPDHNTNSTQANNDDSNDD